MSETAKPAANRTLRLTLCALMAALIAICSQLQIPLPAIPINLALFAVHLAGALLGPAWGTLSVLVYILLGLCGVPVFSGFRAGFATLFGKTGGYLLGYLLDAFLVGYLSRRIGSRFWQLCLSMVIGVAVCYAFGTAWFIFLTKTTLAASLSACVLPFLPGDAVKIVLAALLTGRLKKPLARYGITL